MSKLTWRIWPILSFLLVSIFLWRGLSLDPHHVPSVKIGKALPAMELPDLQHPDQSISIEKWHGQVGLLNVWASWCAACVEEQVLLMQLARQGVPIYGLNYKDEPNKARQWLGQWGNPYQYVASDAHGLAAIDLGVYGAPETFIIDKQGVIRYRHAGIMTEEVWTRDMLPLIKKLEQQT